MSTLTELHHPHGLLSGAGPPTELLSNYVKYPKYNIRSAKVS